MLLVKPSGHTMGQITSRSADVPSPGDSYGGLWVLYHRLH